MTQTRGQQRFLSLLLTFYCSFSSLFAPVHYSPCGGNHREKCVLDTFLLPKGALSFCVNEEPELDSRFTSSSSSPSPSLSLSHSAGGEI